jgi:hypothetical protein
LASSYHVCSPTSRLWGYTCASVALQTTGYLRGKLETYKEASSLHSQSTFYFTLLAGAKSIVVTTYFSCHGRFYAKKGDIFLKKIQKKEFFSCKQCQLRLENQVFEQIKYELKTLK